MPSYSSSSSWRGLPVAVGPLEGTGVSSPALDTSSAPPPSSSLIVGSPHPYRHLRPRGRRPLRVLYPPSLSRRPPPRREAPDPARRWLLFLSALLFLQIYTEEACTCTELQSYSPDMPQPQEGEGGLGTARAWAGVAVEDQWTAQTVAGPPGNQLECVVA